MNDFVQCPCSSRLTIAIEFDDFESLVIDRQSVVMSDLVNYFKNHDLKNYQSSFNKSQLKLKSL